MRALQPKIPSPTTIPLNWHIIIIDLQDCFLKKKKKNYSFIPSRPRKICSLSSFP